MSYSEIIKVLEKGIYTTCEYCGNDKENTSKIKVRNPQTGKTETWYICDDCVPDCFGIGY